MSARRQHFIYIPGLGDGYDTGRELFISPWRLRRGVTAELVSMHWLDPHETHTQKQQRIAAVIDNASKDTDIYLIGESAGGAMAISMLDMRSERISRVVTICGLNLNVHNVSPRLLRKNRAFRDSVIHSEKVISRLSDSEKRKLHIIYSRLDPVVTKNNTLIPSAQTTVTSFPGHMWSIVLTALLRFSAIRS